MELKHTPGPWEVATKADKFIIDSPKTKNLQYGRIADVQQYGDESAGPMRVEAEANARLIAAAPDLLEALMTLPQTMFWSDDDLWKWSQNANAAIAKATGENR